MRSAATTAPWYDRQRPDAFADALRAAKAAVDPAGALIPGVLIDPVRAQPATADGAASSLSSRSYTR
jgi:hypothetical protein